MCIQVCVVCVLQYILDCASVTVSQCLEQVGFLAMHGVDVAMGLVVTVHHSIISIAMVVGTAT